MMEQKALVKAHKLINLLYGEISENHILDAMHDSVLIDDISPLELMKLPCYFLFGPFHLYDDWINNNIFYIVRH